MPALRICAAGFLIDVQNILLTVTSIKQQKSKAIAFTFRPFLATYSIFHKCAKNSKKVRLYIALTFRPFLGTFSIFHKWA
jgi:hypothetical protein